MAEDTPPLAPGAPKKNHEQLLTAVGILGILMVVGIPMGLWINYLHNNASKAITNLHPATVQDPLCKYAAGLQMNCVAILADESELAPGSMVEFPNTPGPNDGTVCRRRLSASLHDNVVSGQHSRGSPEPPKTKQHGCSFPQDCFFDCAGRRF